jgi:hypothetical protein
MTQNSDSPSRKERSAEEDEQNEPLHSGFYYYRKRSWCHCAQSVLCGLYVVLFRTGFSGSPAFLGAVRAQAAEVMP